jgi:Tol biopolymer transport system component
VDGSNAANGSFAFIPNVWLVGTTASGPLDRPLTTFVNTGSFDPARSPDGFKVAFVSDFDFNAPNRVPPGDPDTPIDSLNIFVVNLDGTNVTPLTRLTAGVRSSPIRQVEPVWSPDGTKIAFLSDRALDGSDGLDPSGNINLWVMNADGTAPTPLTRMAIVSSFNANHAHPAWSPDSSKIAFQSNRALDGSDNLNLDATGSPVTNIWIINADGTGLTPMTKSTGTGNDSFHPAWSPDGTKIAFDSQMGDVNGTIALGTSNIWSVNADGSGLTPLTRLLGLGADSINPVWSPDSNRIAFQSTRAIDGFDGPNLPNQTTNIWVMNADGGGARALTRLTAQFADSRDPIWSPDGNSIICDSARFLDGTDATNGLPGQLGTANLWTVPIDGASAAFPMTFLTAVGATSSDPGGVNSPNIGGQD